MDYLEIKLNYNRKDYEEVYFRNGGEKTFLNKHFRKELYTLLLLTILTLAGVFYVSMYSGNNIVLIFLSTFLFFTFWDYFKKGKASHVWKKGVIKHLDLLGKVKNHKIVLKASTIEIIQDDFVIVENWIDCKGLENEPTFICIIGKGNYVFPKKAMTEQEFKNIRLFVSEKIVK